ncbi:MAG: hypothetical protein CMK89_04660 [Pseudomonadales bacterium]|nr:hypothetical protein [Pseudomonadales bacterium]
MNKLFKLMPVLLPVSIIVALSFPALALGVRFDIWGFRLALPLLAGAALTAAILLALAGVGLLAALRRQQKKTALQGIWIIVVLAVPVAMVFSHGLKASQLPVLYDISTSWDNPPPIAERPEGANPLQSAETNRELQRAAYPEVTSLVLSQPREEVLARVEQVAKTFGWGNISVDTETGILTASDTTFWFGFVDDVAVRVTALAEGGTQVDVRSVSRVGKSDLGKNADRIRSFLAALRV